MKTDRDWLLVKQVHREVYKQRLIHAYLTARGGLMVEIWSTELSNPITRAGAVLLYRCDNVLTARRWIDKLETDEPKEYEGADHD